MYYLCTITIKNSIMTTTQLIYSNPNEAYRKIVTTKEIHDKYVELEKTKKLPNCPTTKDFDEQTTEILLELIKSI